MLKVVIVIIFVVSTLRKFKQLLHGHFNSLLHKHFNHAQVILHFFFCSVCTRWLHEECVIDCIVDANGKEGKERLFLLNLINCIFKKKFLGWGGGGGWVEEMQLQLLLNM